MPTLVGCDPMFVTTHDSPRLCPDHAAAGASTDVTARFDTGTVIVTAADAEALFPSPPCSYTPSRLSVTTKTW